MMLGGVDDDSTLKPSSAASSLTDLVSVTSSGTSVVSEFGDRGPARR